MALFDDTAASRTERPTERRRRQARERGLVARSVEWLVAARLLATWIVLAWWFASFVTFASSSLRDTLEQTGQTPLQATAAISQLRGLAWSFATTVSWPLLTVTSAILLAHFVQVGWLWQWENAAPQPARLSPISGLQRLCSATTFGRALRVIFKLALVISVSGLVLSSLFPILASDSTGDLSKHVTTFGASAVQLVSRLTLALLVFGIADYAWQRWRFERSLLMTSEEVREELRDVEGDPHVKHHRHTAVRRRSITPLATSPTADPSNHSS